MTAPRRGGIRSLARRIRRRERNSRTSSADWKSVMEPRRSRAMEGSGRPDLERMWRGQRRSVGKRTRAAQWRPVRVWYEQRGKDPSPDCEGGVSAAVEAVRLVVGSRTVVAGFILGLTFRGVFIDLGTG